MKAMPVTGSHRACFDVVLLCWTSRFSRTRFPACREGNAREGLASCLVFGVVFLVLGVALGVAVLSSLRFPACREGNTRQGLASCLVFDFVYWCSAGGPLESQVPRVP